MWDMIGAWFCFGLCVIGIAVCLWGTGIAVVGFIDTFRH